MPNQRDAKRTQHYIDDALGRFSRTQEAWAYLRAIRRLGDDDLARSLKIAAPIDPNAPYDLDLADAEHYMYARFLAGNTGDSTTRGLVVGYELVKVVKYLFKDEKSLRTDPRFPVLPPSGSAVDWGLKGVNDGLTDFAKANPGKSGKLGAAYEANKDLASSQYKKMYR